MKTDHLGREVCGNCNQVLADPRQIEHGVLRGNFIDGWKKLICDGTKFIEEKREAKD